MVWLASVERWCDSLAVCSSQCNATHVKGRGGAVTSPRSRPDNSLA